MSTPKLKALIAEDRALRAELCRLLDARRELRSLISNVSAADRIPKSAAVGELRIIQMTSLLVDAHEIARWDDEGLTIDLITDALEHLNGRLESEVLPRYD